jgi:bifunctional UDP-N-acetylglucosamine pyrophosphorylase/glucosamine-1-phosphate N-acetyltransferase
MVSTLPKVMHRVAGVPMIGHIARAITPLQVDRSIVVIAPGQETVLATVPQSIAAIQEQALGTGHAVLSALPTLADCDDHCAVLIIFGDTPMIETETLQRLSRGLEKADLVVLGFTPADPSPYGRLILEGYERLNRIVEAREASPEELAIGLCNAGLMAARLGVLRQFLPQITNANSKKEYYLTDIVALMRAAKLPVAVAMAPPEDVMPVNSRAELAAAEAAMQARLRARAQAAGVTFVDPSTVYLAADTVLGQDVEIGPQVFFGPGVVVESGAQIRAFCHIEGAHIAAGAIIGPFARLRPGADIGAGAHIGNFVEVKNTKIGVQTKVNHLTYLGDAVIGRDSNIGAGTITCNYDGFKKHRTDIGDRAFIGSNSSLVAPLHIGSDTYVGSGSVITRDVPDGNLAVARADSRLIPGWVARFRARFAPKKA